MDSFASRQWELKYNVEIARPIKMVHLYSSFTVSLQRRIQWHPHLLIGNGPSQSCLCNKIDMDDLERGCKTRS